MAYSHYYCRFPLALNKMYLIFNSTSRREQLGRATSKITKYRPSFLLEVSRRECLYFISHSCTARRTLFLLYTMHTHWSQFVPNMSARPPRTSSSTASSTTRTINKPKQVSQINNNNNNNNILYYK